MLKDDIKFYQERQKFISNIDKAIKGYIPNVEQVRLECLVDSKEDRVVQVLLVIRFKGGNISVRNCYGNSDVATLQEFSRLCLGGYYEEVDNYFKYKQSLINLEDYISGEY